MDEKTLKAPPIALIVLAVVACATPIIGGQYPTDGLPLQPGVRALAEALLGGGELALATFLLLVAPCAGVLALHASRSRVIQLPTLRVLYWLFPAIALMGCTLLWTKFAFIGSQTWTVWLAATLPLFAVCAVGGRVQGPRSLLWAVTVGCAVTAAKGIGEYAQMRALDPGWRIFGSWINPNELAVVMLIGLFLAMGLMLTSERNGRIVAGAAAVLCGFALLLTQSLGSELVGIAALPCFLALAGRWGAGKRAFLSLVPVAIVACLFAAMKLAPPPTPTASVAGAGKTAEAQAQSIAFRVNLWRGAIELARRDPQGVGIGAYRYHSARPGLTTQTHLAHNTYLQVTAEAGIAGGVLLVGFVVAWLIEMLKGARGLEPRSNLLRASVVCAVGCVLAHSMGDSDLYHPGMALMTFLLMGVGLCLSADGVAPEVIPPTLRIVGIALIAAIIAALGYFAFGEYVRASVQGAAQAGDRSRVQALTQTLRAAYPSDGATWRFAASYAPEAADPAAKLNFLRRAARLTPSTSNLRALAVAQWSTSPADSIPTLRNALTWDPNNLPTLKLLVLAEEAAGQIEQAVATARRLIAVEQTPYFQVRALPNVVPTETFWAREWLAKHEADPRRRAELMQGAVDGYLQYASLTVPQVKQADRTGMPLAGESLEQALETLRQAQETARQLARLYRELGLSTEAGRAEAAAEELGAASM